VVVETIREFENAGMNVSLQLRQTFVLLHSYIIVKSLVRYHHTPDYPPIQVDFIIKLSLQAWGPQWRGPAAPQGGAERI
jgi:hypothetical protein